MYIKLCHLSAQKNPMDPHHSYSKCGVPIIPPSSPLASPPSPQRPPEGYLPPLFPCSFLSSCARFIPLSAREVAAASGSNMSTLAPEIRPLWVLFTPVSALLPIFCSPFNDTFSPLLNSLLYFWCVTPLSHTPGLFFFRALTTTWHCAVVSSFHILYSYNLMHILLLMCWLLTDTHWKVIC